jgi:hypothetical protein
MTSIVRLPTSRARPEAEVGEKADAALAAAARSAAKTRRRTEGRDLSLATLTVIGALSLGGVAGLAYLTEGSGGVEQAGTAVIKAVMKPAAPAPAPVKAADAKVQPAAAKTNAGPAEPAATKVARPAAASSDTGPKSIEAPTATPPAPVAAPPAPVRPAFQDPIKTASISPAVPLPPMTLPPQGLLPAEPIARPLPQADAKPVEPTPAAPKPQARPAISREEADGHMAKGEAALRSGDLTVARLFFGRVAQSGDPRGALAMARTYDESELRALPVYGLTPDRAEAERWRQRARDMTSALAQK